MGTGEGSKGKRGSMKETTVSAWSAWQHCNRGSGARPEGDAVTNLGLDVIDGVRGLDLQSDGLAGQARARQKYRVHIGKVKEMRKRARMRKARQRGAMGRKMGRGQQGEVTIARARWSGTGADGDDNTRASRGR